MTAYKSAPTPGMKIYNAHNPQHMKAFKAYAQTQLLPELERRVYKSVIRCMCDETDPLYQWNINHPDIDLKARVRQYLYNNFPSIVQKFYYNADTKETVGGYLGWYEFPKFGCLAFFTPDDGQPNSYPDTNPLFRW